MDEVGDIKIWQKDWFEALSNYKYEQIEKALKRFKAEHQTRSMITPGKFMEYRKKIKDISEEIAKQKELSTETGNEIPIPDAIKRMYGKGGSHWSKTNKS